VDLVFYGNQRQLEYDFVVAPGADAGRIAWRIEGARASIDAEGNLLLDAAKGLAMFKKPVLYQLEGDRKTSVEGSFVLAANQVRFRLGAYDHSRPLIIDPVLSYSSYLAGSGVDSIGHWMGPGILGVGASQGLAVDSAGSVYVTGYTMSTDFPTKTTYKSAPPAKQAGYAPVSVFVTKFSPDGSSLVYSTYLGGGGTNYAYAIAVDSGGNAYVTGNTYSVDFPVTTGAYQTVCSPLPNNSGPPYASACNTTNNSVFVTKLNSMGTGLAYSTFLGGFGGASGKAIAVDTAGRAYVGGDVSGPCSSNYAFPACFPTTSGAVIAGNLTGGRSPSYAFVAVFDPAGAKLLYSTLFGDLNGLTTGTAISSGLTLATGVTVDASGNFYLIGDTQAGKLPTTAGVVQPKGLPLDSTGSFVTAARGYVAKFRPVTSGLGASLAYATYLGGQKGNASDYPSGIVTDSAGNAYIGGRTQCPDFPVTSGAYQTVCASCTAAFVTKLDPSGSTMLWSTFVGGSRNDGADNVYATGPIALDGSGNVYITGSNASGGFAMVNPVESHPPGGEPQVLIAELDPAGANLLFSTTIGDGALHDAEPAGLAVDSAGNIYLAGTHIGPGLITTPGAFQETSSDSMCCYHGFVARIAAQGTATASTPRRHRMGRP
jgi:hypothetical protein